MAARQAAREAAQRATLEGSGRLSEAEEQAVRDEVEATLGPIRVQVPQWMTNIRKAEEGSAEQLKATVTASWWEALGRRPKSCTEEDSVESGASGLTEQQIEESLRRTAPGVVASLGYDPDGVTAALGATPVLLQGCNEATVADSDDDDDAFVGSGRGSGLDAAGHRSVPSTGSDSTPIVVISAGAQSRAGGAPSVGRVGQGGRLAQAPKAPDPTPAPGLSLAWGSEMRDKVALAPPAPLALPCLTGKPVLMGEAADLAASSTSAGTSVMPPGFMDGDDSDSEADRRRRRRAHSDASSPGLGFAAMQSSSPGLGALAREPSTSPGLGAVAAGSAQAAMPALSLPGAPAAPIRAGGTPAASALPAAAAPSAVGPAQGSSGGDDDAEYVVVAGRRIRVHKESQAAPAAPAAAPARRKPGESSLAALRPASLGLASLGLAGGAAPAFNGQPITYERRQPAVAAPSAPSGAPALSIGAATGGGGGRPGLVIPGSQAAGASGAPEAGAARTSSLSRAAAQAGARAGAAAAAAALQSTGIGRTGLAGLRLGGDLGIALSLPDGPPGVPGGGVAALTSRDEALLSPAFGGWRGGHRGAASGMDDDDDDLKVFGMGPSGASSGGNQWGQIVEIDKLRRQPSADVEARSISLSLNDRTGRPMASMMSRGVSAEDADPDFSADGGGPDAQARASRAAFAARPYRSGGDWGSGRSFSGMLAVPTVPEGDDDEEGTLSTARIGARARPESQAGPRLLQALAAQSPDSRPSSAAAAGSRGGGWRTGGRGAWMDDMPGGISDPGAVVAGGSWMGQSMDDPRIRRQRSRMVRGASVAEVAEVDASLNKAMDELDAAASGPSPRQARASRLVVRRTGDQPGEAPNPSPPPGPRPIGSRPSSAATSVRSGNDSRATDGYDDEDDDSDGLGLTVTLTVTHGWDMFDPHEEENDAFGNEAKQRDRSALKATDTDSAGRSRALRLFMATAAGTISAGSSPRHSRASPVSGGLASGRSSAGPSTAGQATPGSPDFRLSPSSRPGGTQRVCAPVTCGWGCPQSERAPHPEQLRVAPPADLAEQAPLEGAATPPLTPSSISASEAEALRDWAPCGASPCHALPLDPCSGTKALVSVVPVQGSSAPPGSSLWAADPVVAGSGRGAVAVSSCGQPAARVATAKPAADRRESQTQSVPADPGLPPPNPSSLSIRSPGLRLPAGDAAASSVADDGSTALSVRSKVGAGSPALPSPFAMLGSFASPKDGVLRASVTPKASSAARRSSRSSAGAGARQRTASGTTGEPSSGSSNGSDSSASGSRRSSRGQGTAESPLVIGGCPDELADEEEEDDEEQGGDEDGADSAFGSSGTPSPAPLPAKATAGERLLLAAFGPPGDSSLLAKSRFEYSLGPVPGSKPYDPAEAVGRVECDALCDTLGQGCPACNPDLAATAVRARATLAQVVAEFWLPRARRSLQLWDKLGYDVYGVGFGNRGEVGSGVRQDREAIAARFGVAPAVPPTAPRTAAASTASERMQARAGASVALRLGPPAVVAAASKPVPTARQLALGGRAARKSFGAGSGSRTSDGPPAKAASPRPGAGQGDGSQAAGVLLGVALPRMEAVEESLAKARSATGIASVAWVSRLAKEAAAATRTAGGSPIRSGSARPHAVRSASAAYPSHDEDHESLSSPGIDGGAPAHAARGRRATAVGSRQRTDAALASFSPPQLASERSVSPGHEVASPGAAPAPHSEGRPATTPRAAGDAPAAASAEGVGFRRVRRRASVDSPEQSDRPTAEAAGTHRPPESPERWVAPAEGMVTPAAAHRMARPSLDSPVGSPDSAGPSSLVSTDVLVSPGVSARGRAAAEQAGRAPSDGLGGTSPAGSRPGSAGPRLPPPPPPGAPPPEAVASSVARATARAVVGASDAPSEVGGSLRRTVPAAIQTVSERLPSPTAALPRRPAPLSTRALSRVALAVSRPASQATNGEPGSSKPESQPTIAQRSSFDFTTASSPRAPTRPKGGGFDPGSVASPTYQGIARDAGFLMESSRARADSGISDGGSLGSLLHGGTARAFLQATKPKQPAIKSSLRPTAMEPVPTAVSPAAAAAAARARAWQNRAYESSGASSEAGPLSSVYTQFKASHMRSVHFGTVDHGAPHLPGQVESPTADRAVVADSAWNAGTATVGPAASKRAAGSGSGSAGSGPDARPQGSAHHPEQEAQHQRQADSPSRVLGPQSAQNHPQRFPGKRAVDLLLEAAESPGASSGTPGAGILTPSLVHAADKAMFGEPATPARDGKHAPAAAPGWAGATKDRSHSPTASPRGGSLSQQSSPRAPVHGPRDGGENEGRSGSPGRPSDSREVDVTEQGETSIHPTLFAEADLPEGLRWKDSARSGLTTFRSGGLTGRSAYGAFGEAKFAVRTPRDGRGAGLATCIEAYQAVDDGELTVPAATVVMVEEEDESGWWLCRVVPMQPADGDGEPAQGPDPSQPRRGYLPCTFLQWASEADLPPGGLAALNKRGLPVAELVAPTNAATGSFIGQPGQVKPRSPHAGRHNGLAGPSSPADLAVLTVVPEEDDHALNGQPRQPGSDEHTVPGNASEHRRPSLVSGPVPRQGSGLWRYNLSKDVWERRDPGTGEVETSADPFAEEWAVEDIDAFDLGDDEGTFDLEAETARAVPENAAAGKRATSKRALASQGAGSMRSLGSARGAGLRSSRGLGSARGDTESFGVPYVAHSAYEAADEGELSMEPGDVVFVREFDDSGWWEGRSQRTGEEGWLPSTFVVPVHAMASARLGDVAEPQTDHTGESSQPLDVVIDDEARHNVQSWHGVPLPMAVRCPSGWKPTKGIDPRFAYASLPAGSAATLLATDEDESWGLLAPLPGMPDEPWVPLSTLRPDLSVV